MKIKLFGVLAAMLILSAAIVEARSPVASTPPAKRLAVKKSKLSIAELTRNVEFKFCKADLPMDDLDRLNELADFMLNNKYAVSLRGHADAIGTYVGNWKMSEKRAEAVKDYLLKKGVDEERIVTTAFGSTVPIANNKTSLGRQKNRRVEFRLKEIGGV